MTRRGFLSTGLALFTTGCLGNPVLSNAASAIKLATVGHPDPPIKRSVIARLPYATIAARFGKGPRAILVLGRNDRGDLHWISGDRAAIVTRGGRVVKTAGLSVNLKDVRAMSRDPVAAGLHALSGDATFTRFVDIDRGRLYGVPIDSRFAVVGRRAVVILELPFDTILVRERNVARTLNWSFENAYWVDPEDGFVWKSRQHVARDLPPIELEVLKPAAPV